MEQLDKLHASCVYMNKGNGQKGGILIKGESGSGKSDLVLRLIDRGAELVGDDWIDVYKNGKRILLSSPERIRGILEIRGLGLFNFNPIEETSLSLIVNLVPKESIERLPEDKTEEVGGIKFPAIDLFPFEESAPIKLERAFKAIFNPNLKYTE